MHNVTLIKGDGIGPSIMEAAVAVINASGAKIHWHEADAGMSAYERTGTPLPDATMESIAQTRVAFKGPLTTMVGEASEVSTWNCANNTTCMPTCVRRRAGKA